MADISASAERRAELIMRDAELEAENMLLDAKVNVRKLTDEHSILSTKVNRLKANFRKMLETELERIDADEFDLIRDLEMEAEPDVEVPAEEPATKAATIIMDKSTVEAAEAVSANDGKTATVSDLAESLKAMADEPQEIDNTIILK